MASDGPRSPGQMENDSSVGLLSWNTPGNSQLSDDIYTTAVTTITRTTYYLKVTGFGFLVPSGATIDGIVVEIERRAATAVPGDSYVSDSRVRIVINNTIGTTDKASGSSWPTSDTYASYGSSTDLWGETWTPTTINSNGFGVALSATQTEVLGNQNTAYVDHIRITVYYTGPTTTSTSTSTTSSTSTSTSTTVTSTSSSTSTTTSTSTSTSTSSSTTVTMPLKVRVRR